MEIEKLKALIREAFKDVQYPGDDNIAGCSRIGCDDCEPLAAHFKGTTWQQHTLRTLAGFDSLNFFYTKARHYYFPAYMLAGLEDYRLTEIHFSQSEEYKEYTGPLPNLDLSWHVIPSEYESIQKENLKFVSLLSPQQRQAIIEYLKHMDIFEGVYEPDEDTLKAIDFLENS